MYRYMMLALFLLPSVCYGQVVTFPVKEIKVKPGVPVYVLPVVDGDDIKWKVSPELNDITAGMPADVLAKLGHAKVFSSNVVGTHLVSAFPIKCIGMKAKFGEVSTMAITILGASDDPIVIPPDAIASILKRLDAIELALKRPPVPVTPPVVVDKIVKNLTFIGAEATVASRSIVNDASLRTMLSNAGVVVRVHTLSEIPESNKGFLKAVADAGGVPCIVLQGSDNRIINQMSIRDATVQSVSQFVSQYIKR